MFGLSILAWRWILYGALALTLLGTGAGIYWEWTSGIAAKKEVATIVHNSSVQTKAVTKADAQVAKSDETAQAKIVTVTRTIHERIPTYVTVRTPCIPWSVVRVHDAAALGVDPSTLPLPAGATLDACSTISTTAFLDGLNANYGAARANAQQLNDLIADASAREQAVVAAPGPLK